jgi:hypothetical protein
VQVDSGTGTIRLNCRDVEKLRIKGTYYNVEAEELELTTCTTEI